MPSRSKAKFATSPRRRKSARRLQRAAASKVLISTNGSFASTASSEAEYTRRGEPAVAKRGLALRVRDARGSMAIDVCGSMRARCVHRLVTRGAPRPGRRRRGRRRWRRAPSRAAPRPRPAGRSACSSQTAEKSASAAVYVYRVFVPGTSAPGTEGKLSWNIIPMFSSEKALE